MNKIQPVSFFSMTIFILSFYHMSNAMLVIPCPEGMTFVQEEMKCMTGQEKIIAKQKREEQARIDKIQAEEQAQIFKVQQEKIAAQAEADRILKESIIKQQEEEKIQKENEAQLRIKDLEDRIKKLEEQQSSIHKVVPVKKLNIDSSTSIKKEEPRNIQIEPTPTVNNETVIKESTISNVEVLQTPQEKVGWFKRLLSWFNLSKK